jgi:hypothetical protein
MLTECPHCFTRVLPRPDGQCPACQKSTVNVSDAERKNATVIVTEKSKMPEFCCMCMVPERRTIRLARSRDVTISSKESSEGAIAVMLLYVLLGAFAFVLHALHLLLGWKSPDSQRVVVRVRQCRACSHRRPLDPIFVNFDAYTMKFVVHRDFAKLFEELNGAGVSS